MNNFINNNWNIFFVWPGLRFLCNILVAPVKNEIGEIILFIVSFEDITESAIKMLEAKNSKGTSPLLSCRM